MYLRRMWRNVLAGNVEECTRDGAGRKRRRVWRRRRMYIIEKEEDESVYEEEQNTYTGTRMWTRRSRM